MMRSVVALALISLSMQAVEWSPSRAAEYLDARQKAWFAWPPAKSTGGPCVSCHTGVTYLMARPALRKALGETQPTEYETGLINGLKARLEPGVKGMFSFPNEPLATQGASVEAAIAALFLGSDRSFHRLWSLQKQGALPWFSLNLDPWEVDESKYYGAALAAVAAGTAADSSHTPQTVELTAYLQREFTNQPLHNRLLMLWVANKLPAVIPTAERTEIINAAFTRQHDDGGWTINALGPFARHEAAPPSSGANAYATALAAYLLQEGGVKPSDPRLNRALDWLKSHQDPHTGAWTAASMNKTYPPGSMQSQFMNEAATGYAALALLYDDARRMNTDLIPYPQNYRDWTHVKSAIIGPGHPAAKTVAGLHHIYANAKARDGYRSHKFADGSVIVYELLELQDANAVSSEGPRRRLDMMVKDSARFSGTGGWGFERFMGTGDSQRPLAGRAKEQCFGCHNTRKASDFVFSDYRK